MPAEDARFVLPNAAETKIVVTMNARELLHFFNLRCCRRAQWEIRAMATEMLRLARRAAPLLFAGAGPGCLSRRLPGREDVLRRRSRSAAGIFEFVGAGLVARTPRAPLRDR